MQSAFPSTARFTPGRPIAHWRWAWAALAGAALTGQAAEFSDAPYATVLAEVVNPEGRVDYDRLAAGRAPLDRFVTQIAELNQHTYRQWPRPRQLAFWINTYNALTLTAVADHYPVDSIRDIGSLFVSVWDKLSFTVMGQPLTLTHIEHEILRKEFADPRIHLAINCASVGCPPLANTPFRADTLDEQFAQQARAFLANPTKFRIDRAAGRVYLSPIFKWFGEDFVGGDGSPPRHPDLSAREGAVINFIAGQLDPTDRTYLQDGRYRIKYLSYDWKLNRQPKP